MTDPLPASGPVCLFLLGVNDSRTVEVIGFTPEGKLDYDWPGNTEFIAYTHTPHANKKVMPILWFRNESVKISAPDIFVNCLSDADTQTKSLAKAIRFLERTSAQWPEIPVINHPRHIAGTRRDVIYQKFRNLPGIDIPKTVRFQPKNRDEVLAPPAKEGFIYPFIVRRCGAHNGREMTLVESPAHAAALDCLAFDGSFYYITQFRDYKDAAGLYKKLRFMMIDGKIYPRHFITARHWKVSSGARADLMKDDAGLRELEGQTLSGLEGMLSPAALGSVQKIYRESGLDYLGFDGHLLPNGDLLVFEINVAMNAMAKSDYALYPYLQDAGNKLIDGYNALLAARISESQSRRRAS